MKYLSRNLVKTSVVKSDITAQTTVTAVGTDYVLISDTSNSGNLKKALASDLAGGGLTIGDPVSGGGANRVLYEDGSGNLAASSLLLFTGSELQVKDTANLIVNKNLASDTQGILDLQVVGSSRIKFNPYDGGLATRITCTANPMVFENVDATGQFIFNAKGSYIFRENGNSWFYLTNSQTCGINVSSPSAKFEVRVTSGAQFCASYDGSNYFTATVGSTGGVTFDAVGSGAGFTFSDAVTVNGSLTLSAQNIVTDTTTGMKIGTGTTQKIGFFNATPVVQRSDFGALTDSTSGTPGTIIDDPVGGGDTVDVAVVNDNFASLLTQINAIRTVLRDLGLMA